MRKVDQFQELFRSIERSRDTFKAWRRSFAQCNRNLGRELAQVFNRHRFTGKFPAPEVTPEEISSALRDVDRPFDPHSLSSFYGFALGDQCLHIPQNRSNESHIIPLPTLYSVWGPVEKQDEAYVQRITASTVDYVAPDDERKLNQMLSQNHVNLLINAYYKELGIVNWTLNYQDRKTQLRAIAYDMRGKVLWINQLLNPDSSPTLGPLPPTPPGGDPLNVIENQFLITVEWPEDFHGKNHFNIYGLHMNVDFENSKVAFAGRILRIHNELVEKEERRYLMRNQQSDERPQPAPPAAPPAQPSLPDLNAQTYPFSAVQRLIDQAAYINTYAAPVSAKVVSNSNSQNIIGLELHEKLYDFEVVVRSPSSKYGLKASNVVGAELGNFKQRWLFMPDDFSATPESNPPFTTFDPTRSQRFVMEFGDFAFGDGDDGFRGFGAGRTFPINDDGRQVMLSAAVGEILDGYGKFKGLEGSYVLSGELSFERGFEGNLQCRLVDPRGQLRTESDVPFVSGKRKTHPKLTFIMFRGQKRNERAKTSYVFGSQGQPQGFMLKQELRAIHLNAASSISKGLRSSTSVGQVIGWMSSQVFLNILAPGAPGTSFSPIPFSSLNEFHFTDDERDVGSFVAEGGEGRTFNVQLAGAPEQKALRFGAFQNLTNGTGRLNGLQGLLTDNSIVGVAPHATSTLYVACIYDPEGRFRA